METITTLPLASIRVGPRLRPLRDAAVSRLVESIAALGLHQPIVVTEAGVLVAGNHRLEACRRLGYATIPAIVRSLDGLHAELVEIDENLIRNELTVMERGEHLARRKAIHEVLYPETRQHVAGGKARQGAAGEMISFADTAAGLLGVTSRTVEQEIKIAALPAVVKDMIRGTPLADRKVDLLELARLPDAATQTRVAAAVVSGDQKDVRAAMRRQGREDRIMALGAAPALPGGPFQVLLADPPWRYEHVETESRAIENHYPTMALEDICALPVANLAADPAILFLWVTPPKDAEAHRVLDAWGFRYRTQPVWVKPSIGPGYYVRQQHELLFIAVRGAFPVPLEEDRLSSVFYAPRGRHSEKPEQVYEWIERMYPTASRIELFSRSPRPGWAAWGLEAAA